MSLSLISSQAARNLFMMCSNFAKRVNAFSFSLKMGENNFRFVYKHFKVFFYIHTVPIRPTFSWPRLYPSPNSIVPMALFQQLFFWP